MSLLITRGLGFGGQGGSSEGELALEVVLQDVDTVVVEQTQDLEIEVQELNTVVVEKESPTVDLESPDLEVELD